MGTDLGIFQRGKWGALGDGSGVHEQGPVGDLEDEVLNNCTDFNVNGGMSDSFVA